MGTLFKDQGATQEGEHKVKCNTCVCQLLNQLANRNLSSVCSTGRQERLLLILKGTSEPLSVGGMNGTEFTLVHFDPETCCAVFSYKVGMNTNGTTKTIVLDCRCICSVVCVSSSIDPY